MPSPPRILFPGHLTLITTRTEEGLPFVGTQYMRLLIKSALARAQHLYPTPICAACMMGNHLHLLVVVSSSEVVMHFMERVKTELSHAVNRLLGRRKRTVWCDGYDAVPILTVQDVIDKFVYLYTNPQNANLEERIEKYPGFSTWTMFESEEYEETVPWIRRPAITPLTERAVSPQKDTALSRTLSDKATDSFTLSICPFAWFAYFGISQDQMPTYKHTITEAVREKEKGLQASRTHACIGADALRRQAIDKPHTPKKFGRRMWCICANVSLRIDFVLKIKALLHQAKQVYQLWKTGDFSLPYPYQLFPPRFPILPPSSLRTA